MAIASYYKDWTFGGGLSSKNIMSYGDIPHRANDYSAANLLLPRGAIINGDLAHVHEIDLRNPDEIQEFVSHSWYKYPDESKGLHPWDGVTEPNYHPEGSNFKGTRTKIEQLDESAKYSWIKAPRWKGNAMEVGPLSRMVLGYVQPEQYPFIKDTVDSVLHKLDLPVTALFSTLGRTAARGIETLYCAKLQEEQFDKLIANLKAGDSATANVEKWDPSMWPKAAKGVGFTEAPRGSLGHWIKIRDTKIENYQCVVPTTWNGSPRDPKGQIGAFEAALMNTPLAKADQPLEILRTLHSFDPCLACSTHVMSPEGQELSKVTVR
ncbi:nickel-dependent hydrogenase large subunit [mine drainage metagenome]|uniref:Nickel-dependent hydrogenase large subunit n=1 Tax=mine drainage metagenome TaxID=410659 RepID=T1C196_9ZZZZ